MKQYCDKRNVWRILVVSFALALSWSCATLPPAKSIGDVKDIAGKWEGSASFDKSTFSGPTTLTIYESGACESTWPKFDSGSGTLLNEVARYSGRGYLSEGKFSFGTSTYTLHEGSGRRVLSYAGSNPGTSAILVPVKK